MIVAWFVIIICGNLNQQWNLLRWHGFKDTSQIEYHEESPHMLQFLTNLAGRFINVPFLGKLHGSRQSYPWFMGEPNINSPPPPWSLPVSLLLKYLAYLPSVNNFRSIGLTFCCDFHRTSANTIQLGWSMTNYIPLQSGSIENHIIRINCKQKSRGINWFWDTATPIEGTFCPNCSACSSTRPLVFFPYTDLLLTHLDHWHLALSGTLHMENRLRGMKGTTYKTRHVPVHGKKHTKIQEWMQGWKWWCSFRWQHWNRQIPNGISELCVGVWFENSKINSLFALSVYFFCFFLYGNWQKSNQHSKPSTKWTENPSCSTVE